MPIIESAKPQAAPMRSVLLQSKPPLRELIRTIVGEALTDTAGVDLLLLVGSPGRAVELLRSVRQRCRRTGREGQRDRDGEA